LHIWLLFALARFVASKARTERDRAVLWRVDMLVELTVKEQVGRYLREPTPSEPPGDPPATILSREAVRIAKKRLGQREWVRLVSNLDGGLPAAEELLNAKVEATILDLRTAGVLGSNLPQPG
jgi:hypothetical protein